MRFVIRGHPRHAFEQRQHGRRVSRRVLLIAGIALIGGPLAYIVIPEPVAALPAAIPSVSPVALAAAAAPSPGLVGGVIEPGDLLADPVGVASSAVDLVADGALIGWPVSDHTPSTGFGYRSDPFTHRQRWHDGVDLGQACGDPAWASLSGTVEHAGWAGGYGNRVVLRHEDRAGQTFATTYNHLAKIEVKVGQAVGQGAVVGRIGSTGRSTACHMHFEVILDGSYVDPMRFLTGDTSKAGLSRRVGSFMPAGSPSSPDPTASSAARSPSRTPTTSSTPTATTPAATTPAATTPAATTPAATTPAATTPAATTPAATTPAATTPAATTPAATTPAATTPAATTPNAATFPASDPPAATVASTTAVTPAAARSITGDAPSPTSGTPQPGASLTIKGTDAAQASG